MNWLLVGFQPKGRMTYPHLQQVAQYLFARGVGYALFRERGYFLGDPLDRARPLHSALSSAHAFAVLGIDILRLVLLRLAGRRDGVIAVDNFSYLVASHLFPNVVLWSHDFVTDDQPRSRRAIHRFIKAQVGRALRRQCRLVIQDRDRLELFCATYLGDDDVSRVDAFLLPVSLLPVHATPSTGCRTPPVLMQIGGISASRSRSDELLEHFQAHHASYDLALHGYIEPAIARRISAAAAVPWVSCVALGPGDVYRIVEKCDIGFIAYNSPDQNFFHVARASGQLAEFMRCGKPVIALGPSSLAAMLDAEQAGIGIDDIEQLADAVQRIGDRHADYSRNCRRLFAETYDLAPRLPALVEWLTKRHPT
jgi:glycosyltransferase involved in cell wall biosynthesis